MKYLVKKINILILKLQACLCRRLMVPNANVSAGMTSYDPV